MLYHERESNNKKMKISFIFCIFRPSYAMFSMRRFFIDVRLYFLLSHTYIYILCDNCLVCICELCSVPSFSQLIRTGDNSKPCILNENRYCVGRNAVLISDNYDQRDIYMYMYLTKAPAHLGYFLNISKTKQLKASKFSAC